MADKDLNFLYCEGEETASFTWLSPALFYGHLRWYGECWSKNFSNWFQVFRPLPLLLQALIRKATQKAEASKTANVTEDVLVTKARKEGQKKAHSRTGVRWLNWRVSVTPSMIRSPENAVERYNHWQISLQSLKDCNWMFFSSNGQSP